MAGSVSSPSPGRLRSPSGRLTLLCAGIAGLAVLLYVAVVADLETLPTPARLPGWVIALLTVLGAGLSVDLHVRRESRAVGLTDLPVALGLLLASPHGLLLGRIAGAVITVGVLRRHPSRKHALTLALGALTPCVALTVYRGLDVGDGIGPRAWLAAVLAMTVSGAVTGMCVTLAAACHDEEVPATQALDALVGGAGVGAAEGCLGVVAALALVADPRAGWLLIATAGVLLLAYRGYAALRERHEHLGLLYEFTQRSEHSPDVASGIAAMLTGARTLLRAEVAEIVLLPGDGRLGERARLGPGDVLTRTPFDPAGLPYPEVVTRRCAMLLGRGSGHPALAALGVREMLVAPLTGGDGLVGTIAVGDRAGDVRGFTRGDLQFFETVASHAGISIENGHLIDRLRHEALHDGLTGLANRTLFGSRLAAAIASVHGTEARIAVLYLDLDRFKEVNDTLGHHNGDRLLSEVSRRLPACVGPRATVARLGGDDFGVLIGPVADETEALGIAREVARAVERPVELEGVSVDVSVSVGVAVYPDHGTDVATLFQRADVALAAAKSVISGIAAYASDRDEFTPRRLALVGELRRAIERDELALYYQPKAELATGRVIGVEALLRWNHPQHGFLPPDEFVPLAEHTGLIRSLTRWVLRTALTQCAAWHAAGLELGMSVNLSARNLLDPELPDDVDRLLRQTGVPASRLTLEMTESSVLSDPARTIAVLQRLAGMGVSIAVDDFGTGYSSLAYLGRLPVHEVKVDKSFVLMMTKDRTDAVIVRSIIDLGVNLGLTVVAEGVEDETAWRELATLGCDQAQGYFLSRPVPAAALTAWLTEWRPPGGGAERRIRRVV